MAFTFGSRSRELTNGKPQSSQYLLWIDGVGSFLVCTGERFTIGGPTLEGVQADLSLLASLSRRHATIVRGEDGYVLESHAPSKVAGRDVHDMAYLNDGYDIELGGTVKFRFRMPTALSASARLEFLSDHRPSQTVDSLVLMDDTCLLGPGDENHIRCPEWPGTVLLIRKQNELWCKSRLDVFVGDKQAKNGAPLKSGEIVSGSELRFRLEAVQG